MMRTHGFLWFLLVGCAPTVADESPPDGFDNSVSALQCPDPGTLPFPTRSSSFSEDASIELLEEDNRAGYAAFDLLGSQSGEARLEGWMGRHVEWDTWAFEDEHVSVWGWTTDEGWTSLGREETDRDGEFGFDADSGALPDEVAYAVLEGSGHCAALGVFEWPAGTKVVIADIDGTLTLSDNELFAWFADEEHVPVAREDADRLLQTWADKGYGVVYLTGRPHPLRGWTRGWFEDGEMPWGPLKTAPELLSSFAAVQYKGGFLTSIQEELGWEIVAAYGNSTGDIQGYEAGGVPKEITFTVGEGAGTLDTVSLGVEGFGDHIDSFVVSYPDAP